MKTPNEFFMESLKGYNFLNSKYVLYPDKWPCLKVKLTTDQYATIRSLGNNGRLISIITKCEQIANAQNRINTGILGSTKHDLKSNIFTIEGSEAVIELILKEIFGKP